MLLLLLLKLLDSLALVLAARVVEDETVATTKTGGQHCVECRQSEGRTAHVHKGVDDTGEPWNETPGLAVSRWHVGDKASS